VPQMFRPELNLKKSHILYVNRHKSRRAMGDDDIEIPPSQTGSVWGAHGRLGRNLGPGPLSSSWPDRSRGVLPNGCSNVPNLPPRRNPAYAGRGAKTAMGGM
jgi:hypothetical protein